MAIDISTEQPVPLADVRYPGRAGKKIHFSTIWRWVKNGLPGPSGSRVRLEAVRLGGRWVTSTEAIQRFCEALTPRLGDAPTVATAGQQERAARAAGEKLAALGI